MKFDVDQWIGENVATCLYDGDDTFLSGPTERTTEAWKRCMDLLDEEQKKGGVLDVDTSCVSTITSHKPGYILGDRDVIVGLQTDYPLKRACKPAGGCRMVENALEAYGHKMTDFMRDVYTNHRKTHNDGVFDAYDDAMRAMRSNHLLTGLPDAYGRGRIIGDYRRAALYGIDALIAGKEEDKKAAGPVMTEEIMRTREELSEQIRALKDLNKLGQMYGCDISRPAENVKEAIQWTYFAYLAAVKEQDGAAMSLGRLDSFIDIFASKDLESGKFTESEIQEMIDDFVIKLRFVRHLRTPAFEQLFSGGPTWVTATVGGLLPDGRPLVTKTSFRILQTLHNMGPAPEPNMTILWSTKLPMGFKRYCSKTSIQTSAVQYENDDVMRPIYGSDYSIACCVSAMKIGKQMQFFGARINLPKLMLYVINEGKDEITGKQVGPKDVFKPFPKDVPLEYDDMMERYKKAIEWGAGVYANTMNCIHYMHDKYNYEKLQMAFHDSDVHRFMAYGCAGLSVVADSLSAIRFAKVTPTYHPEGEKLAGLTNGFKIEGTFPTFGNDDDSVDEMAKWSTSFLINELRKHKTYRNSEPTLSVLTITSNVVYGNATGATPDGRVKGAPFAPGANPMHGRDSEGALASLNSVAKIDFDACRDGISYTFSIVPSALGKADTVQLDNLSAMLDGYFVQAAHHLNVNVLNREMLMDAMVNPDKYPQLTIRVSGYAVKFTHLTKEQQTDVISRTFHTAMVADSKPLST